MQKTMEQRLYRWGLLLLAVLAIAIVIRKICFPDVFVWKWMPPCFFYTVTGFYCPGCGGTRAVAALLSGKFLVSVVDHPLVLYAAAVYVWFLLSHTLENVSRGRWQIGMKCRPVWLYVAFGIILVNWIVRNVIAIQFGIIPFLPLS